MRVYWLALAVLACSETVEPLGPTDATVDGGPADGEIFDAPADAADANTDAADAGPTDSPPNEDPCRVDLDAIRCPFSTLSVDGRNVLYRRPTQTPPPTGWPVVLMFQGSFIAPAKTWTATAAATFGQYHQGATIVRLLEAGFAVLTPDSKLGGTTFWDTNVLPFALDWDRAPDHEFMVKIFEAIDRGAFGPLDKSRMFATGFSSGGYMTSRMAVAFPGRFRALAIASASYATCAGPICLVPNDLPADHPPTLFLHGQKDPVVPIVTMRPYRDALDQAGRTTKTIEDPNALHEWLAAGVTAVPEWFQTYR